LIFTGTPQGVGAIGIGDKLQGFLGDELIFTTLVK
jgi:acylpyruvate hydrolase